MQGLLINRIKDFRLGLGMTQEDLAGKVGVTRQTIISTEKGVYAPSITLAILLCRALEKEVEQVFTVSKK